MGRRIDLAVRKRLLQRLERDGWLRRQQLVADGIHPRWLRRLQDDELIEKVRPGLYRSTRAPETTYRTLFDACAAVPTGVICLTSALAYHELTTANPPEVQMAIPQGHWRPKIAYPPIEFFEFRSHLMKLGLKEVTRPNGAELRVFGPERAICDAFRLRRIVGKDLALEALQTYLRRRRPRRDLNELMRMARATRVERLIRPYVEALAA
jgi:predicted transcriptional regulator of viral defense system